LRLQSVAALPRATPADAAYDEAQAPKEKAMTTDPRITHEEARDALLGLAHGSSALKHLRPGQYELCKRYISQQESLSAKPLDGDAVELSALLDAYHRCDEPGEVLIEKAYRAGRATPKDGRALEQAQLIMCELEGSTKANRQREVSAMSEPTLTNAELLVLAHRGVPVSRAMALRNVFEAGYAAGVAVRSERDAELPGWKDRPDRIGLWVHYGSTGLKLTHLETAREVECMPEGRWFGPIAITTDGSEP
jgi:hypothetical protein